MLPTSLFLGHFDNESKSEHSNKIFFFFHELFCFCNFSLALFTVTHNKQPEPKNELAASESEIMRKKQALLTCIHNFTSLMFRQVHVYTYTSFQ